MNKINTQRIATTVLLLILASIIVFHLLVLIGVIPFEIVWGGRLKNASQMLAFETLSIVINLLMLSVVGVHAGLLKVKINRRIIRVGLWSMVLLFLVNTIGNLASLNHLERVVFTPLTLLLSLCSFCLAIQQDPTGPVPSRKTTTKAKQYHAPSG